MEGRISPAATPGAVARRNSRRRIAVEVELNLAFIVDVFSKKTL
jgi:hypothetical protein